MQFLVMINRLLDLKLVQWTLLSSFVILLGYATYLEVFQVKRLQLQNAYLAKNYAEVSAGLATQNENILEMGRKSEEQKKNLDQAAKQASKIALETNKTMQGILAYQFKGECPDMVTQALEMINKGVGGK